MFRNSNQGRNPEAHGGGPVSHEPNSTIEGSFGRDVINATSVEFEKTYAELSLVNQAGSPRPAGENTWKTSPKNTGFPPECCPSNRHHHGVWHRNRLPGCIVPNAGWYGVFRHQHCQGDCIGGRPHTGRGIWLQRKRGRRGPLRSSP